MKEGTYLYNCGSSQEDATNNIRLYRTYLEGVLEYEEVSGSGIYYLYETEYGNIRILGGTLGEDFAVAISFVD